MMTLSIHRMNDMEVKSRVCNDFVCFSWHGKRPCIAFGMGEPTFCYECISNMFRNHDKRVNEAKNPNRFEEE